MKITGDANNINRIEFTLNSVHGRYICYMPPMPGAFPAQDLMEPNTVRITFDDSIEIDYLIKMLEQFRNESVRYAGIWTKDER